jgi:uncharacterized metal-binding protein YceD (DUF177 family)
VDKLKVYEIPFKGLKDGQHEFDYKLDAHFFEVIEESLINDGEINAKVLLTKTPTMFTLTFDIKGVVKTQCDRCLDPLEVPVSYKSKMYVKFGEEYDEPSDEIIVLPQDEHSFNVAHLLYEFIGISLPVQKVHKKNGCNPEMISRLSHQNEVEPDEEEPIDPRWNELKKLIDKNK